MSAAQPSTSRRSAFRSLFATVGAAAVGLFAGKAHAAPAGDMMRQLMDDNRALIASMREAHAVCDEHRDVATVSLLEEWINQAEMRVWFLFEASRGAAH